MWLEKIQKLKKKESKIEEVASAKEEFIKERERLAQLCKMGDCVAMYDMALLILSTCTEEQQNLIRRYEDGYSETAEKELEEYMKRKRFLSENRLPFYMMWIVRAALYGNEIAQALLERCPCYRKKAYIRESFYTHRDYRGTDSSWSGEYLYQAGCCDVIREPQCGLIFYKEERYFELYYVDSYISADEYGYGSETEYNSVYYDEFFRKIPILYNKYGVDIKAGLKKVEEEREEYWRNEKDCSKRKYVQVSYETKKFTV